MGHKGPVLRPRCIRPGRARNQIPSNSIQFKYHETKAAIKPHFIIYVEYHKGEVSTLLTLTSSCQFTQLHYSMEEKSQFSLYNIKTRQFSVTLHSLLFKTELPHSACTILCIAKDNYDIVGFAQRCKCEGAPQELVPYCIVQNLETLTCSISTFINQLFWTRVGCSGDRGSVPADATVLVVSLVASMAGHLFL